ncbi:MAG: radical SAM protein [Desulfomonilaceae bacterium]
MAIFLFINVNHDVGRESSESIPISLGYVLAAVQAAGGSGVILDDLRDGPLTLKTLEKWIRKIQPDIVGFTAYQCTMHRIRFLCRYVKSRYPHILTMLGGPQIFAMPSHALFNLPDVDILVRGDGEYIVPRLAAALDAERSLDDVEGITFRRDGEVIDARPLPRLANDLDEYPSPYLKGILNLQGKTTAILLSSRGCKHVCRFCITPKLCGGAVRYHSIERVISEMEFLARMGIERFWFADPNFTEDKERTSLLLEEKIRRGIGTPFWCQTRADLVDADMLRQLKHAGADTIAFGLESGSPQVLQKTGKRIELDQLEEHIRTAQALGMETELFSIFGLPGETVEDARRTMEFLKSLGIPIQSNSGSQQMQLYFGSVYERDPEKFGIVPRREYRPAYLSIGEDYETTAMSARDLAKVRNLWALANEQMETDVYYKQRTFEVLQFLIENRDDLAHEPSYYAYGALASAAIEDYFLLEQFLEGYERLPSHMRPPTQELLAMIPFFQESSDPIQPQDRVIFDSRSFIDGIPFTGISGKYWDVLLGRGLLLEDFEAGFLGARAGMAIEFSFVFPNDYFQAELGGKQVEVHAKIHKVFTPIAISSIDELKRTPFRNKYCFNDLNLLRDQNEILYYLALRDADPATLLKTPTHFLALVHRLAKLSKYEEIGKLAALIANKPTALHAFAETLAVCGKYEWALPYYEALSHHLPSAMLKQIRCLLHMGQHERAAALMSEIPPSKDYEYQQVLLECLMKVDPGSERIPELEHQVMDLRVKDAVTREAFARGNHFASRPVVHGFVRDDARDEEI